jgi:hypothetical protein
MQIGAIRLPEMRSDGERWDYQLLVRMLGQNIDRIIGAEESLYQAPHWPPCARPLSSGEDRPGSPPLPDAAKLGADA